MLQFEMKGSWPPFFFLASFYCIPFLRISVLVDGNDVNLKNNINHITLLTKQNYLNCYNFKFPCSKKYMCINDRNQWFSFLFNCISIFIIYHFYTCFSYFNKSYPAFVYVSLSDPVLILFQHTFTAYTFLPNISSLFSIFHRKCLFLSINITSDIKLQKQ